MRLGPIAVATMLVFVGTSSFVWADDSPDEAALPPGAIVPDAWRDLHRRWGALLEELKMPGFTVAVVRGNEVVLLDALGTRDAARKLPASVDSPYYIASSTKSFTAMAVAILVDEGKIELDAPVRRYLPRFTLTDPQVAERMTIRDLLAHRRGINSGPIATCEAYTGLINEDRYYRLLAMVTPKDEFRYSNLNFTLAGRVIEAVSGKTWKEFIAERILRPAGMRHSYCLASQLYADPLVATPLEEIQGQWQAETTRKVDETMHAAGGMGASAADLARWIRLNWDGEIDGTRIVSQRMLGEMQAPQIAIEDDEPDERDFGRSAYGLGWFLGEYRGHKLVHHFGGYAGTRCHISLLPEKKLGVAVLVNAQGPAPQLAEVVAAEAYDRLLELESPDRRPRLREQVARSRAAQANRPRNAGAPPSASAGLTLPPRQYAGEYFHEDYGTARIAVEDGKLSATLGAHRATLVSTGADQFRTDLVPGSNYSGVFELDDAGREVVAIVLKSPLQKFRFVREGQAK